MTVFVLFLLSYGYLCYADNCVTLHVQGKSLWTSLQLSGRPNYAGLEYPPFLLSPAFTTATSSWLCYSFPFYTFNTSLSGHLEDCTYSPTFSTNNGFIGLHMVALRFDGGGSIAIQAYQNTFFDNDRQMATGMKIGYTGTTLMNQGVYLADLSTGRMQLIQSGYCELNSVADHTNYPNSMSTLRYDMSCRLCDSWHPITLPGWIRCEPVGFDCTGNSECCLGSAGITVSCGTAGKCCKDVQSPCTSDSECCPDVGSTVLCGTSGKCCKNVPSPCTGDADCCPSATAGYLNMCINSKCTACPDLGTPCGGDGCCPIAGLTCASGSCCLTVNTACTSDLQCCPPTLPDTGTDCEGSPKVCTQFDTI